MEERAAAMEKLRPVEEDVVEWEEKEKEGGSTRAVRRRESMPTRFRVGERPAGAECGVVVVRVVSIAILRIGERAVRIGRLLMGAEVTCCVGWRVARVR